MARLRLVIADTEERRRALAPILGASFGFPSDDALVWQSKAGEDNVRALVDGDDTGGPDRDPDGAVLRWPIGPDRRASPASRYGPRGQRLPSGTSS